MNISDLINKLKSIQLEYGNIDCGQIKVCINDDNSYSFNVFYFEIVDLELEVIDHPEFGNNNKFLRIGEEL